MAERVVRRVGPRTACHAEATRFTDAWTRSPTPQDLGLPAGPAALHPPGRRRDARPGRRSRSTSTASRTPRAPACSSSWSPTSAWSVPRRAAALLRASTPGATPPSPTCSPRWRRRSGRELREWAAQWLETARSTRCGRTFELDADGRYTAFAVAAGGARADAPDAAHPPDRDRPVRPRRRRAGPRASGSSWTSPARGPRSPSWSAQPRRDVLLLNDDDLTYAKLRLDERSLATRRRAHRRASTTRWPARCAGRPPGTWSATPSCAARDYVDAGAAPACRPRPTSAWSVAAPPGCRRALDLVRRPGLGADRLAAAGRRRADRAARAPTPGSGLPAGLGPRVRRGRPHRRSSPPSRGWLDGSRTPDGPGRRHRPALGAAAALVAHGAAGDGGDRGRARPRRHRDRGAARRDRPRGACRRRPRRRRRAPPSTTDDRCRTRCRPRPSGLRAARPA